MPETPREIIVGFRSDVLGRGAQTLPIILGADVVDVDELIDVVGRDLGDGDADPEDWKVLSGQGWAGWDPAGETLEFVWAIHELIEDEGRPAAAVAWWLTHGLGHPHSLEPHEVDEAFSGAYEGVWDDLDEFAEQWVSEFGFAGVEGHNEALKALLPYLDWEIVAGDVIGDDLVAVDREPLDGEPGLFVFRKDA